MRISAEKNDLGHGQYLVCKEHKRWPRILLDGAEIKNVVTADSDKGFVTFLVRGKDGRFVIDRTGEAVQLETLAGVVTFEFPT